MAQNGESRQAWLPWAHLQEPRRSPKATRLLHMLVFSTGQLPWFAVIIRSACWGCKIMSFNQRTGLQGQESAVFQLKDLHHARIAALAWDPSGSRRLAIIDHREQLK